MSLVLFILFACLCFVLPLVLYRKGTVSRLTVVFWCFFGLSALAYGETIHFLYRDSTLDPWTGWIGPALVQVVFAFLIYLLERKNRTLLYALLVAFLGSFLVTGLWLMTAMFFLR